MTRSLPVGLVLLLAVACFGSSTQRLKQRLVGVSGIDLRLCIGVPENVSNDGQAEFLTYRWAVEDDKPLFEEADEKLDRARRPGRVQVPGEGPDLDPFPSPEDELKVPKRQKPKFGYCELVFEMREGKVHAVEVEGRTSDGLNTDGSCLIRARRCIPKDAPVASPPKPS